MSKLITDDIQKQPCPYYFSRKYYSTASGCISITQLFAKWSIVTLGTKLGFPVLTKEANLPDITFGLDNSEFLISVRKAFT